MEPSTSHDFVVIYRPASLKSTNRCSMLRILQKLEDTVELAPVSYGRNQVFVFFEGLCLDLWQVAETKFAAASAWRFREAGFKDPVVKEKTTDAGDI